MSEQDKAKEFATTKLEGLIKEKFKGNISKFAKEMKVSRPTVYRWKDGTTTMSLFYYYKALEVLGLKETVTSIAG